MLHAILTSRITAGALSGLLSGAAGDFMAFRAWKNWHDAVEYDWSTASWRWVQGAVIGAVTALGWGAAVS